MYIQRALDLGAYGIIVPQVDTKAQAEAVAASVRYAPAGARSWGPVRGSIYGGADYFSKSAEELLTLPMLESAQALRNAREIIAVPGIDGCFVGPADLNITLGFSPEAPGLGAATDPQGYVGLKRAVARWVHARPPPRVRTGCGALRPYRFGD